MWGLAIVMILFYVNYSGYISLKVYLDLLKNLIKELLIFIPGIVLAISFLKDKGNLKVHFFDKYYFELYSLLQNDFISSAIIVTGITIGVKFILFDRPLKKELEKYQDEFTEQEIDKKYEEFMTDAKSLYICGGKLDFLKKNASTKQLEKINKLSNLCKIISYSNKESLKIQNKEINKELKDNKVQLKNIPLTKEPFMKGQVKENKLGVYSAMFVAKQKNGKYKKFEIKDQKTVKILKKEMDNIYETGEHPYIKYILMDLGGVYFEGDLYNFLEKINIKLKEKDYSEIEIKSDQKVILEKDLNLGKTTIIDFIEENVKKECNKSISNDLELQNFIKDEWQKTWEPNQEMENIVIKLKEKGIKVYPSSNLDKMNRLNYSRKNYFEHFSEKEFFSCEMGVCKPDKEYYDKVLESLKQKDSNFYSYEVLLIDDKKENIEVAKSKNIETIFFKNAKLLKKELIEKEILEKWEENN